MRVKPTPYQEGDPAAPICFIAEAPARNEMRLGRPLVGESGQIFDQLLHAAGLIRANAYIINVIENPIESGEAYYYSGSDKGVRPELGRHLSKFTKRLGLSKANIFVPMGGLATAAMTEKGRILRWRGSVIESTRLRGRKTMPTIHPAATTYRDHTGMPAQYIWRYFIQKDFEKAKLEAEFPEIRREERMLRIDPTFAEAIAWIEYCREQDAVAVDTEVINHQISCVGLAVSPHDAMCIPLTNLYGQNRWTEVEEARLWTALAGLLEDESITKIGQNFIFDMWLLLFRMRILVKGDIKDTMIAQRVMYPDFPAGLDFLCSMHTDIPYYKDEGKIWRKQRPSADEVRTFWSYNAKDAVATFACWLDMEAELESYRSTYDFTIALYEPLLYMMVRGLNVDADRLADMKEEVKADLERKRHDLEEVADYPFNPLSPKQCRNYFYTHKGIKPYVSSKTGQPTVDDKALQMLVSRHGLPEARLAQDIRGLSKLAGTYLDIKYDEDRRLRCMYNPRGANTMRLSSQSTIFGTGMNLQNLPPVFKDFIVVG